MKHLALSALIGLTLATPLVAQQQKPRELSAPIVAYTPVIAKNADALGLTEDQRTILKNWLDTMPANRKALEAKAIAARAALRDAINANAPKDERQALAAEVGALETQMVMMRSNCTDHWRGVLTEEQFTKMQALAAAK